MLDDVSTVPLQGFLIAPCDLSPNSLAALASIPGVSATDEDGAPSRTIIIRAHTQTAGYERWTAAWEIVRKEMSDHA